MIKIYLAFCIQPRKAADSAYQSCRHHHKCCHAIFKGQPFHNLITVTDQPQLQILITLDLSCTHRRRHRVGKKAAHSYQRHGPESLPQILSHQLKK